MRELVWLRVVAACCRPAESLIFFARRHEQAKCDSLRINRRQIFRRSRPERAVSANLSPASRQDDTLQRQLLRHPRRAAADKRRAVVSARCLALPGGIGFPIEEALEQPPNNPEGA